MKRFSQLYQELDETTKTSRKVAALVDYFQVAPAADAAWATWFLCGNRPRRVVATGKLREWCAEIANIPEWLLAETYDFVGDLAETLALLLPPPTESSSRPLSELVENWLLPVSSMPEHGKKVAVTTVWNQLDQRQRLIFNKLLTGSFRVGVSQKLVIKALSEFSQLPTDIIAQRLMGQWKPSTSFFAALLSPEIGDADTNRPYPFFLASTFAIAESPADESADHPELADQLFTRFGSVADWLVEWKWDGIRAQILRRHNQITIWSRGEELITEGFPEVLRDAARLPDGTVLDGELVGWKAGRVLPFADLQKRISRRTIGKKLLADVPVRFLAFDLLEENGLDLRQVPLHERRNRLAMMERSYFPSDKSNDQDTALAASPELAPASWDEAIRLRQSSRKNHVEGLMLKRVSSHYDAGRVVGSWWKWKIEPYHCDAVLIYAQRGHGRRASKFTDYTFAAWDQEQLVPFAKAYSGLTDAEIKEVDKFIRDNTLERFGPVTSVKAELVFELAFEGMQLSNRHKAGIAVRFPRISRWRRDKKPEDADTLQNIRSMVPSVPATDDAAVQPSLQSPPKSRRRTKKRNGPLGGLFEGIPDPD